VAATSAKAKESPIWLLIPVGLLSLVLVIPAAIAGVNWYRNRRAEALFGD
jgi:predicted signal transduction protein with EAL and GGDEF domain